MVEKNIHKVPVLSYKTLSLIKESLDNNDKQVNSLCVSLDLNLSFQNIDLDYDNYSFKLPSNEIIPFSKEFNPNDKVCYAIFDHKIFPLKFYNAEKSFFYKLVPTSFRPILRISATQMHKKPFLDFIEKLRLKGTILDAGTGLGYSAIIASKTATKVITIEWDPNVLDIASYNPHSRELFESPAIEIIEGDVITVVKMYTNDYFDNIIQDGGMPKSSGNFFSQEHCYELYRILKPKGMLIFYLPQHGKSNGRDFGQEHLLRLKKAGFIMVTRNMEESYALLQK